MLMLQLNEFPFIYIKTQCYCKCLHAKQLKEK